jgi:hypothetical protein
MRKITRSRSSHFVKPSRMFELSLIIKFKAFRRKMSDGVFQGLSNDAVILSLKEDLEDEIKKPSFAQMEKSLREQMEYHKGYFNLHVSKKDIGNSEEVMKLMLDLDKTWWGFRRALLADPTLSKELIY